MKGIWGKLIGSLRDNPTLRFIALPLVMLVVLIEAAIFRFQTTTLPAMTLYLLLAALCIFLAANQIIGYRADTVHRSATLTFIAYVRTILAENKQVALISGSGYHHLIQMNNGVVILHVDSEDVSRARETPNDPPEVVLKICVASSTINKTVQTIRTTRLVVKDEFIGLPGTVIDLMLSLRPKDALTGKGAIPAELKEIIELIAQLEQGRIFFRFQ